MEKSTFQSAAGDFHLPASFTALLMDDDDDDDILVNEFSDERPLFLHPLPGTLESLIPPSVLSGGDLFHLRKRAQMDTHLQCQIPLLNSPDELPMARNQKFPRLEIKAPAPTLESILNGFSLPEFVAALMDSPAEGLGYGAPPNTADMGKRKQQRETEKTRRQRVSEKVRCLGKLIPGEVKKMNTATMLEEAYDYIKFLEAQIMTLSSMPEGSAGGEVLEAVVNSAAAQAVLSSKKYCVVSKEQVAVLLQRYC